ncbi:uncharacterized protein E0L32_000850 [Thyridium curvatum]|uniref:Uncharacterized protein n=1 Tax=Thyridium curvatum TaxID=1093900 RepID=A0A507AYG0_9PEZI|nr:uncharacterized protein E0L32_000850 [Thyridium curvatum]TPX12673.1 hypothetical protein E0L32_000850 [Thyridium curvatum]
MGVSRSLKAALQHLIKESKALQKHQQQRRYYLESLDEFPTSTQLQLLRQLLCLRSPEPPLPDRICENLQSIYAFLHSHRFLTHVDSLQPVKSVTSLKKQTQTNLILWQGDITTLTGVAAITNAANSQMLGCFQPSHRCIDNVIHSWAGPGLRQECYEIMSDRTSELPAGDAITTRGHHLPVPYVIHTVGPQLRQGDKPTETERRQLEGCYTSILREAELLTVAGSRKAIALCCVSTGLFAFPPSEAAEIAVRTTTQWLEGRDSTITDVIFTTFTDADTSIYQDLLKGARSHDPVPISGPLGQSPSLQLARSWLKSADAIVISAGAGLSASSGLDYTSTALFAKHFPGFLKYDLTTLYSVFGFAGWPSEQDRWGYYFTHMNMIKSWPKSSVYGTLIAWLKSQAADVHVRTSNADGLFLANGWSEEKLSTPQGTYAVLQCLANCRPDATFPTMPYLDAATPFLDPVTQHLTSGNKIPLCEYCHGPMSICVRAGDWFNERPFAAGEQRWREFKRRNAGKQVVVLELGAGNSTPGVLKWPNENMVERSGGLTKLIRVGMGLDAVVSLELEEEGQATYIDGNIREVVPALCLP